MSWQANTPDLHAMLGYLKERETGGIMAMSSVLKGMQVRPDQNAWIECFPAHPWSNV